METTDFRFEGPVHGAAPVLFFIWLIFAIGAIIGWIIFLVAVWRGMKAHESIAESVKRISEKQ